MKICWNYLFIRFSSDFFLNFLFHQIFSAKCIISPRWIFSRPNVIVVLFSCSHSAVQAVKNSRMKKPCTKLSLKNVMKTLSKGSKAKGTTAHQKKERKIQRLWRKVLQETDPSLLKEDLTIWVRAASKKGLKWQLRDLKLLKKLVKSSGIQSLKKEKQSNWGKHQTFSKANPEEKEKVDQLSKKGKGLAATMWLLKKEHPSCISVVSKVSTNQTLTKGEVWESEKTMLDRFGKDEFQIHLNSGRIKWREDAWSEGVFHYYDQGNIKKKKVATGSEWTQGQGYQAEEEDQEQFAKLRDKDLHKHLHDMATLPKGKGKETGNGNVKRKKAGAKDSWLLKMAPWMMMRKEKRKNLMMTAKKRSMGWSQKQSKESQRFVPRSCQ